MMAGRRVMRRFLVGGSRALVPMPGRVRRTLCRVAADEDGQSVALAALLILVLVMFLTVTLNLAIVAHQKIQVQTAVDAAAKTGAVWQIRGLAFVQSMNNLIWIGDALADITLTIAAAFAPFVGFFGVGLVGNVFLGVSVVSHALSQFAMIPLRWLAVHVLFAASEMAARNETTPIPGLVTFAQRLTAEYVERGFPGQSTDFPNDYNSFPALPNIPIYALGVEVRKDGYGLINLHLESVDPKLPQDWPLTTRWPLVQKRLLICAPLQPVFALAKPYYDFIQNIFGDKDAAWSHAYYKTDEALIDEDTGKAMLPPTTWIATVRESDRPQGQNRFSFWTAPWQSMDGLGVPTNILSSDYGELGVVGLASSRAYADPVDMLSFSPIRGQVVLVPVCLSSGKGDTLDMGVSH